MDFFEIWEKAQRLVRELGGLVRERKWGELCALIGFLLVFAAVAGSRPGFPKTAFIGLLASGASLFLFGLWWIGRAPSPDEQRPLTWPKGERPFDREDQALFSQLKRDRELAELTDWIGDNNGLLAVAWGVRGVGKTSLLYAGLASQRLSELVQIYWPVTSKGCEDGLLRAIRAQWGKQGRVPQRLSDLFRLGAAEARRVIILDQVERISLDERPWLLDLLTKITASDPTLPVRWIVCFRSDFMPVWEELSQKFSPEAHDRIFLLPIAPLPRNLARSGLVALMHHYGLSIDQRVVDRLIRDLCDQERRVLPLHLGIHFSALFGLIHNRIVPSIFPEVYDNVGRQPGLLRLFLEERLARVPNLLEPAEALQALQELIERPSGRILPEGRSLEELCNAVRPESRRRLAEVVRDLASPSSAKWRVLEEINAAGDAPRYRLADALIGPALLVEDAVPEDDEVRHARKLLASKFESWRGRHKSNELLSWGELRQIRPHKSRLLKGDDPELRRFLGASRRRAAIRTVGLAFGVVFLGVAALGFASWKQDWEEETQRQARIESWGLPVDLYERLEQIEVLGLPSTVNRLDWLRPGLRVLRLKNANLESLEGLPEGLEELELLEVTIVSASQLPDSLLSLSVSLAEKTDPSTLGQWPPSLQSLTLSGQDFTTLGQLPESLVKLRLEKTGLSSLTSIPAGIEELSLTGANFKSLDGLSSLSSLQTLELNGTEVSNLKGLPGSLRTLVLLNNTSLQFRPEELPPHLESLTLGMALPGIPVKLKLHRLSSNLRSLDLRRISVPTLDGIPSSLTALSLNQTGTADLGTIPSGVEELKLSGLPATSLGPLPLLKVLELYETPIDLSKLPTTVKTLRIEGFGLRGLQDLPPSLEELKITSLNLTDLRLIRASLRRLDLSFALVPRLSNFPRELENLDLRGSTDLALLEDLPATLKSLNLESTQVSELSRLPRSLVTLDLRGIRLKSLEGLPPNLDVLRITLPLSSLRYLPDTVREVDFSEPK